MKRADSYPDAVLDLLRPEFPDLADPIVAQVIRERLAAHRRAPSGSLEFIVDDPLVANWRLHADPDRPGRVRLSDAAFRTGPARQERQDRINRALAALP